MNNLKLKGLLLGLICLFALNINAQSTPQESVKPEVRKEQQQRPHKTPEEKAQRHTDRMTEKLGLNEKQQAEVLALNLQEIKNKKAIRDRMQDKLQAEQMARYKTVLTAEQYAKLEKSQAERQAKGKKGHHGKRGGEHHGKKGGEHSEKKEGEQRGAKGGAHHGRVNPDVRAQKITERMTEKLGLDEKQQADILAINMQEVSNRDKIRTKMEQKLRNEQMARYKTILTPEQYGALEKLNAERQAKRAEHKGKRGKGHQKPEQKN